MGDEGLASGDVSGDEEDEVLDLSRILEMEMLRGRGDPFERLDERWDKTIVVESSENFILRLSRYPVQSLLRGPVRADPDANCLHHIDDAHPQRIVHPVWPREPYRSHYSCPNYTCLQIHCWLSWIRWTRGWGIRRVLNAWRWGLKRGDTGESEG